MLSGSAHCRSGGLASLCMFANSLLSWRTITPYYLEATYLPRNKTVIRMTVHGTSLVLLHCRLLQASSSHYDSSPLRFVG